MADAKHRPDPPFLARWSQRKLAAARERAKAGPGELPAVGTVDPQPVAGGEAQHGPGDMPEVPSLPSVESLSFDSDYKPFLDPRVDEALKRQALRKLVRDPRFNVMDGLDVYIDDYSIEDPIAPEIVAQLNQAKYLFDPPKTRVNQQGHVEDVPDDETTAEDVAGPEAGQAATDAAEDALPAAIAEPATIVAGENVVSEAPAVTPAQPRPLPEATR